MGLNRVGFLTALTFTLALSLPAAGATITVEAGGNLQAALDNAAAGDTILLQAGATFIGNFVVRSGKISLTIRSSAPDTLLPAAGQRTSPQVLGVPAQAEVAEQRRGVDHSTWRVLHHPAAPRSAASVQRQLEPDRARLRRLPPDHHRTGTAPPRARPAARDDSRNPGAEAWDRAEQREHPGARVPSGRLEVRGRGFAGHCGLERAGALRDREQLSRRRW